MVWPHTHTPVSLVLLATLLPFSSPCRRRAVNPVHHINTNRKQTKTDQTHHHFHSPFTYTYVLCKSLLNCLELLPLCGEILSNMFWLSRFLTCHLHHWRHFCSFSKSLDWQYTIPACSPSPIHAAVIFPLACFAQTYNSSFCHSPNGPHY